MPEGQKKKSVPVQNCVMQNECNNAKKLPLIGNIDWRFSG
jgi:hypothetical protein